MNSRKVIEQFREPDGGKKISHITFGMMSAKQMRDQSHVNVTGPMLYDQNSLHRPTIHGVLDRRMGTMEKGKGNKDKLCETCGNNAADCIGHYGHIDLEVPVFHIGYFRSTINILQCICKTCARLLLSPHAREAELRKVSRPNLTYLEKKGLRKKINEACRKINTCPYCSAYNGTVKKCALLKIMHVKYKFAKKTVDEPVRQLFDDCSEAMIRNKDLQMLLPKAQEILSPLVVHDLFCRIQDEDIPFLLMYSKYGRPQDMIITRLIVPPVSIRPSVISDIKSGSTEDDITVQILEIAQSNRLLRDANNGSANLVQFMERCNHLQILVGQLYNSDITGVPPEMKRNTRGLIQRLKGKQGRFRGNLSGKRVNYSGRTVISPDPNLRIDQVGVPEHVAKILSYPERVTPFNIEFLRKLVHNGNRCYPGALSVMKKDRKFQNFEKNKEEAFAKQRFIQLLRSEAISEKHARDLCVGDIVHRHLLDGDVILFNRQPSLHRLSIQSFFAKVSPNRTFSFNECCCNPFNADFDGDEMNLHLPQTEEAKAEAMVLMGSKSNIITPRNGDPLIAAIQDFITGAFLLTQKDTFFDQRHAQFLASAVITRDDPNMMVDLPPPVIIKPVRLWTGKQLFSLIIRPNRQCPVKANLRAKCSGKRYEDKSKKEYKCASCIMKRKAAIESDDYVPVPLCRSCEDYNKYCRKEDMDPNDMFVVINNSELLAGYMEKGNLGSGSKTNIFYVILRDFGEQYAADSLLRLSRMISAFIMNKGFSIGIQDVSPGLGLLQSKNGLVRKGYSTCDGLIKKFQEKQLECQPGFTIEETLEAVLLKELSNIRESAADICLRELPKVNSPLVMALCGSKGSNINISQMIACVGQQSVSGHRVPTDFTFRALPYYAKQSKDPAARGFVANSFHSGLTPSEVFFHTVAGREGLVDTAVKTADTGYMQRRLIKSLEDLCCNYDLTVRNCTGDVIQFIYGSDGLDPCAMESKYAKTRNKKPTGQDGWCPFDFNRVMYQVLKELPCHNDMTITGKEVRELLNLRLKSKDGWEMRSYKLELKKKLYARTKVRHLYQHQDRKNEEKLFDDYHKDLNTEHANNFGRHLDKFICGLISNIESKNSTTNQKSDFCSFDRVTATQLNEFLNRCAAKYARAKTEPGTAVGALAAQSIGEPSTQMTLKTFHFAGVASMNITQGVPRIKEIINASKTISTPIIVCPLVVKNSENFARKVKGRIEKTLLGQISESISLNFLPDDVFLVIHLKLTHIKLLCLEVNVYTVRDAILESKLRLKPQDITVIGDDILKVNAPKASKSSLHFTLEQLKEELPKIIVKGIKTVKRAVMQVLDKPDIHGQKNYELVVEGTNLLAIMTTPGVVGTEVISNHISEVFHTLGIEAARTTIINELLKTMSSHGISVDTRHFMLLADVMCHMGDVLGINRGGLSKMRESFLMLASFEQTSDHIYEAAYHGQKDAMKGVTESIVMGIPMSVGTGRMQLLQKHKKKEMLPRRPHCFDRVEYHKCVNEAK